MMTLLRRPGAREGGELDDVVILYKKGCVNMKQLCRITVFLSGFFLLGSFSMADTVVLKSGKVLSGKILDQTDAAVSIEFMGVPITYYQDEIQSVKNDGRGILNDSVSPDRGAMKENLEARTDDVLFQEAVDIIDQNEYVGSADLKEVQARLRLIIQRNPNSARSYVELARVQRKSQCRGVEKCPGVVLNECFALVEKAKSIDPKLMKAYAEEAHLQMAGFHLKAAEAILNQMKDMDPESKDVVLLENDIAGRK
ncbi:MAG: hypothetical protein V2A70_08065 [Candidatus Omnitrophota bacterium]